MHPCVSAEPWPWEHSGAFAAGRASRPSEFSALQHLPPSTPRAYSPGSASDSWLDPNTPDFPAVHQHFLSPLKYLWEAGQIRQDAVPSPWGVLQAWLQLEPAAAWWNKWKVRWMGTYPGFSFWPSPPLSRPFCFKGLPQRKGKLHSLSTHSNLRCMPGVVQALLLLLSTRDFPLKHSVAFLSSSPVWGWLKKLPRVSRLDLMFCVNTPEILLSGWNCSDCAISLVVPSALVELSCRGTTLMGLLLILNWDIFLIVKLQSTSSKED